MACIKDSCVYPRGCLVHSATQREGECEVNAITLDRSRLGDLCGLPAVFLCGEKGVAMCSLCDLGLVFRGTRQGVDRI